MVNSIYRRLIIQCETFNTVHFVCVTAWRRWCRAVIWWQRRPRWIYRDANASMTSFLFCHYLIFFSGRDAQMYCLSFFLSLINVCLFFFFCLIHGDVIFIHVFKYWIVALYHLYLLREEIFVACTINILSVYLSELKCYCAMCVVER